TTLWVTVMGWEDVPMVRDMAAIPNTIPMPVLPPFQYVLELLPAALAMTILSLVQSAGITQAVPEPDGSTADVNRDFIGQGLANIVNGFFQGMPAGGSLSRTAVNISAGAKTRWANIFSGVFVGLLLLAFGTVIEQITLAALAGHLVVAAFSLFRMKQIRMVWQVSRSARLAMAMTFISTLILPLEYSIYIGVILSLALYVYSSANNIQVVELTRRDDNRYQAQPVSMTLPTNDIIVYSIHGHMYFAAVRQLQDKLPDPEKSQNTIVIMRMHTNKYLGSTGIQFLQRYDAALKERGGYLVLCDLTQEIREQLQRTGTEADFGVMHLYDATMVYFEATDRAYEDAKKQLDTH
ncbi:MAG: SulP family inorganic anion transporter, partial [Aggregatilineales bacterium]